MTKLIRLNLLVVALIVLVSSSVAYADTIRAPVAVLDAPVHTGGFAAALTIDQSGLSTGYVDGVTDFAAYVGSSPVHIRSNSPENYYAAFTGLPEDIDYDMGSSLDILQFALWNYPFSNSGGIQRFEVYTSNAANFAVSSLVGAFTALDDGDGFSNDVQVFDLTDTNARYVRLRVLTTASAELGFSEVAFDTRVVPEPSTLALFGLGTLGIALHCRRRRARTS